MKQFNVFSILLKLLTTFALSIGIAEGIIGGSSAALGQFKFVVSVQANHAHICGGTIISKQYVVTAAMCVIDENKSFRNIKYTVVGGVTNIKLPRNTPGLVAVDVDRIYTLRNYRPLKPNYSRKVHVDIGNIAVLKLVDELNLSSTSSLSYAELPNGPNAASRYVNDYPSVVGFGIDSITKRQSISESPEICRDHCDKLRFAMTTVIEKKNCVKMVAEPVQKNHICAKLDQRYNQNPEGVCDGDIGSPLIIGPNIFIGVLIRGSSDCSEKLSPAIYTRVSSYTTFINNALKDEIGGDMRMAYYSRTSSQTSGETPNLTEYFKFLQ